DPSVVLLIVVGVLLSLLGEWRAQDTASPNLTFLRVVAFAVLLLLFVCLNHPEPREQFLVAIRQASGESGFVFQSVVAAAAYFALLDLARWLHERCGEKLPEGLAGE